ncbi:hypothetical protein SK128_016768 [Halocaridina rubra]|uniref:Uncharacterized protein n=1 Tax=Halocaridina rubra TaxID=373956 RepID=A0AAN8X6Q2_HALRR
MPRAQNSTTITLENSGENSDDGDPLSSNTASNSRNSDQTNRNTSLLPPYPCEEVCSYCGKKVSDTVINDSDQQEPLEHAGDCPCECHLQTQAQSGKLMTLPAHIPPGGPNCLPGCGYFGLPCYNCSSMQNNAQPQEQTSPTSGERFPTHIYTVELVNPDSLNGRQSQDDLCQRQQIIMQNEDSPEARRKRRTCISLLVFIITINVAIAIFRMLSS